jgi:quaternary ammonium compound-resistance protein SugE
MANTLLPWAALLVGGFCELALVHFMRIAKGNILSIPFLIACLIGCLGCVFVTVAMKHFAAGTVYIMWVGLGGLMITVVGMYSWDESKAPLRLLGIGLVLAGLVLLKLTAKPLGT